MVFLLYIIYRGAMKIKGSLSAATKFTPDIFPKPAKMWGAKLMYLVAIDKQGAWILSELYPTLPGLEFLQDSVIEFKDYS